MIFLEPKLYTFAPGKKKKKECLEGYKLQGTKSQARSFFYF